MNRRQFLNQSALAAGYCLTGGVELPGKSVALVMLPDDPVAASGPVSWAAGELAKALTDRGIAADRVQDVAAATKHDLRIVIAGSRSAIAATLARNVALSGTPEAFALIPAHQGGGPSLLACAGDARGLVYAVLELADRVQHGSSPLEALQLSKPIVERPANRIRAISRCFVSNVEDKPWYDDRDFWPPYLTMLAAQRFNRFVLAFGIGYDFTNHITDCYFHFPYPFLLAVPGYDVHASGLADAERDHNLEMLRYISEQTVARGLQFQLGLWTHAYQWEDSPHANHTITGLTPETHGAYCREALRMLLHECPAIGSLAFRVHGESGVAEASYSFWKTVFDGAVDGRRKIEINLHAKGLDQKMVDVALGTGLPVTISPKYWAEHMGLPYHQAAIREQEKPRQGSGFFALSSGSRQFLRYGYGDLMVAGRRYDVYSRMWPGTQRALLWGDPVTAAAYGRASQFAGQAGADILEPLSFKGRRGSGNPGGRCAYADAALTPKYDWQKFLYTYRLWGRLLYNPDADPETWRRFLSAKFGSAATEVENALAFAGRILPLVTTAHGPSAANNTYWPEMYTNMPDVEAPRRPLYGDTPSPKVFENASPFDPQLFATVKDCAAELLNGRPSGRYSPIQVANWLEAMSENAAKHLASAEAKAARRDDPEFRRVAIDVAMQAGLGKFFAAKFRSGVLFSIFEQSGDAAALQEAIRVYRAARDAWAEVAHRAEGVYAADVSFGPEANLRGHWRDRLDAIDADIAAMEKRVGQPSQSSSSYTSEQVQRAVQQALGKPQHPPLRWSHRAPHGFHAGEALQIELVLGDRADKLQVPPRLRYRHVDQAEEYESAEMKAQTGGQGGRYLATIPASYSQSGFALQYYFEVHAGDSAWLLPEFDPNAPIQPYYFVPQMS